VEKAIEGLGLDPIQIERLKTSVGEATMNAIEHGNKYEAERTVTIQVMASDDAIKVRVGDEGSGLPGPRPPLPDLEAKLTGRQSPRGWGLYLIETMVDEVHDMVEEDGHTLELTIFRKARYDD
jgi:anti-sigma regulatory factor (Ser/Thr protein kinase)